MNSWPRRVFKLSLVLLVAGGMVLVYLNAHLSKQFDSLSWAVGAKIYARPLELYQGAAFNQTQVVYELRLLNYQQVNGQPGPGQFRQAEQALVVGMRGHRYPDGEEPERLVRISFDQNAIRGIQTADAAVVDLVRFEPAVLAQLSGTHADRELVSLSDEYAQGSYGLRSSHLTVCSLKILLSSILIAISSLVLPGYSSTDSRYSLE